MVAALALTGCASSSNSAVQIPPFPQSSDAAACPALVASAPTALDRQARRSVTGAGDALAWGRDPIVVRCGVPVPSAFTPTAHCTTVNDVDWFISTTPDGTGVGTTTATTVYRSPAIELTVPAIYGGQAPSTAMVELAAVVDAHSAVTGHCR